jgi:thiamine-phosphate pyrophosphorylase
MANRLALPTLYVILDAALLPSDPIELTKSLLRAGARQFQYRNKTSSSRELLHASQALCLTVRQQGGTFVVNDRADIARIAGATGVHLGQNDLSVTAAREVLGSDCMIGLSTHNLQQFEAAVESDAQADRGRRWNYNGKRARSAGCRRGQHCRDP